MDVFLADALYTWCWNYVIRMGHKRKVLLASCAEDGIVSRNEDLAG